MYKKTHDIFDQIHAEEELKKKTAEFLHMEIQKARKSEEVRGANKVKRKKEENNARLISMTRRLGLVSIAAMIAVVIFVGGLSYSLYITPVAYVDIDVNPSFELILNRFGRVIAANPYNSEGEDILKMQDIRHFSYTVAVGELLAAMDAQGYLRQGGLLALTVQATDGRDESRILSKISVILQDFLQNHDDDTITDVFAVSEEVKNYAHENNISPAKYLAIMELQQVDPAASIENCASHSISEIKQLTHEHSGSHHGEEPVEDSSGEQDDQGQGNSPDHCDAREDDSGHHDK